jgi:hypothetical protein
MKIILSLIFIFLLTGCSHFGSFGTDKPIIHSGHFLNSKLSKEKNEELLTTLENKNYSLVNLTLDDVIIAHIQNIKFENYPRLLFLNSSIIDLDKDSLLTGPNIVPYFVLNGVCFIGLSDNLVDTNLPAEHFLLNDYVLSILKVKNDSQKENPKSYVVIHKLGKEFETILQRLPTEFRALLTD